MFFFLVFFISSLINDQAGSINANTNDNQLFQSNQNNAKILAEGEGEDDPNADPSTEPSIEEPGNITDPGVQSIVQSESRDTFYTVVATTMPFTNGDTTFYSPTEIVSSWVEVYIYQMNVTEIPTPTEGMKYKVVVFKPGILIGVLGGLLFIIGLVYTIFCRKKGLINLSELRKKQRQIAMQNKDSSSDSFDDIKPKKGKKATAKPSKTSSAKPKSKAPPQSKPKTKSKAPEKSKSKSPQQSKSKTSKSKKGHRH